MGSAQKNSQIHLSFVQHLRLILKLETIQGFTMYEFKKVIMSKKIQLNIMVLGL